MFRFSGNHFYRSYFLSALQNVSSPYAAFGLVDVRPADSEFLYFNQWNTEG